MNNKVKIGIGFIAMLSLGASARPTSGSTAKVCHGAIGSWGKVIEVTVNQVEKHLSHGDYVLSDDTPAGGRCEGY